MSLLHPKFVEIVFIFFSGDKYPTNAVELLQKMNSFSENRYCHNITSLIANIKKSYIKIQQEYKQYMIAILETFYKLMSEYDPKWHGLHKISELLRDKSILRCIDNEAKPQHIINILFSRKTDDEICDLDYGHSEFLLKCIRRYKNIDPKRIADDFRKIHYIAIYRRKQNDAFDAQDKAIYINEKAAKAEALATELRHKAAEAEAEATKLRHKAAEAEAEATKRRHEAADARKACVAT